MKKALFNRIQIENGITLVEVVASIVILTIILLSAFQFFIQSAKTTKTSEDIIDATYLAQTEMEKFYSQSKLSQLPADLKTEIFSGYLFIEKNGELYIYQNDTLSDYYLLELRLKQIKSHSDLTRIILKVKDKKNGDLKSQMETTLDWGN